MGDLRFKLTDETDLDPRVWSTAYITGIEGIPWQCHHSVSERQFTIGREIDESGKLNMVWPTNFYGNVCLSTTSLRISELEYSLPVELARGTVCRLKNQTSDWERVGLKLPPDFFPLAETAVNSLLRALTCRENDEQKRLAQQAIEASLESAELLAAAYSRQALDSRKNNEGRLSTLLGAKLTSRVSLTEQSGILDEAFNLASVSPELGQVEQASGKLDYSAFDQQVEWATARDKKICIGPLVNFRRSALPQWMILLQEGFDSVLETACMHAKRTVERYRGKAHLWNCAAGLNAVNDMRWSDEEILRMAVSVIETVRRGDDRTPVLLTIDQPWSEYLRDDSEGISPLHFADALIRADLGLSGLTLELDFDRWPNGTLPRDPIELSRLIDRWAMLGLPLMVIISSPTQNDTAASADQVSTWDSRHKSGNCVNPQTLVGLLLSKPSVHAVIWNNLQGGNDVASNSGLLNNNGTPTQFLKQLTAIRKNYLY